MNQIAQKLKEKNIAEYLIYMWQEEDLIRANHCEMEEMEANVIARYPEDQRPAMREWYGNLITMMSEEGVREKGHLQINKNIIINLTELHNLLSSSPKFPFYTRIILQMSGNSIFVTKRQCGLTSVRNGLR